ncbi:phosphopantetheine attachment site [Streptomyces xiamenensis]|uniref:Phosphopantetheine attachment site n=2 Tax=Streptomyces xiamenensis TaxID=408015 RepID=A0A0F7FW58_9ACTN|nr:acyl carrier protein [Streptomyces sp. NRRL F-2890]AKG44203.1 phosphopantetheine attachment site [Streptomyces xiamenensis]
MEADVRAKVTGILRENFEVDAAALDRDPTLDDLAFDSLTIVELATALEKEFETPVDEEELSAELTVSGLLRLVLEKASTPAAARG